jgi:hypothetical protein
MMEQSDIAFINLLTLKIQGIPNLHPREEKREMMSKLTRMLSGWTLRVPVCVWMKSSEFCHMVQSVTQMWSQQTS